MEGGFKRWKINYVILKDHIDVKHTPESAWSQKKSCD